MKNIGKIGENIACRIIAGLKYQVIERNFRTKFGEIDIIARKSGNLVFFEVKTLINKSVYQLSPEDNLTLKKLEKLNKICTWYANRHPEIFGTDQGWQIDLLTISIDEDLKTYTYKHYENIE